MDQLLANQTVIISSIIFAIALAAYGVYELLGRDPAARRFRGATGAGAAQGESVSLTYSDHRSKALRLVEPFQKAIAQSDPKQVSVARGRLIEAGFYRPSAVEVFFSLRVVLGIGGAVGAGLYQYFLLPSLSGNGALFMVVAAAALGYYLPSLVVSSRISERRRAFKLGMPDALDMLLVGVEAGLSMPASMQHIIDEFSDTHPIIAEQFQIVTLEFRAGKSRGDALAGLAKRMKLQETRTLASMIEQAETLGASLAQTLRVMADELRTQRMLEAEKAAAELPVKMAVPLVCCIFPALMAVALVPAMITTLNFFADIGS